MSRCLALLLLGFAASAPAEETRAWVDCDPAAKRLVVAYDPGDESNVYQGEAVFTVRFMALLELVGSTVVDTHDATVTCRLPGDTLAVRLEPAISNVNLLGRCGAAVGGRIAIARGDAKLVDALPFESADCTELERYVARITVRAGEPRALVEYRRYVE